MKFFKKQHQQFKKLKNDPKLKKEYHQTATHMNLQSKIAAGISMLSIIGLAVCLFCLFSNIITLKIVILAVLFGLAFIISSSRMVHLIVNNEKQSSSNHKQP